MDQKNKRQKRINPCDLWLEKYSADGRRLSVCRRYAAIKRKKSVNVKVVAHLMQVTEDTVRAIERFRIGEPITNVTLTALVKYLSFCELDLFDVIVPIENKMDKHENIVTPVDSNKKEF